MLCRAKQPNVKILRGNLSNYQNQRVYAPRWRFYRECKSPGPQDILSCAAVFRKIRPVHYIVEQVVTARKHGSLRSFRKAFPGYTAQQVCGVSPGTISILGLLCYLSRIDVDLWRSLQPVHK